MKTINEVFPRPFGYSILAWLTGLTFALNVLFGLIGGWTGPLAVSLMNAFGVALVLIGVNGVLYGSKSYETARDVGSTDPIPAGAVPDATGVVEVEGTVESNGNVLQSRATGTDCLAYRWKRYERKKATNSGTKWSREAEGGHELPFRVADDSGTVAVDPQNAEFSLAEESTVGIIGNYTASEKEVEERLDIGETVHVRGTFLDGDDDGRMDESHFAATDDQPLLVADATESRVTIRHAKTGTKHALVGVLIALVGAGVVWLPII